MTKLDDFRGEGRNHDLLLLAERDQHERMVIAVEAKALEPFGSTTVTEQIDSGRARTLRIQSRAGSSPTAVSNIEPRVNLLSQALFGRPASKPDGTVDEGIGSLRYQLLTATVGTAIEAAQRDCKLGLLMIHEFESLPSDLTNHEAEAHATNAREIESLASMVPTASMVGRDSIRSLLTTHPTPFCPGGIDILLGRLTTLLKPL